MSIRTIWDQNAELKELIQEIREENPEISEQRAYEVAENYNWSYLEDERIMMDVPVDGTIICFADLGLWDGRKPAYKEIGDNLSDILYPQIRGQSSCHWYVEDDELKGKEAHHDGTNYYTFRFVSKEDLDDIPYGDMDELLELSMPLADKVKKIYGWS